MAAVTTLTARAISSAIVPTLTFIVRLFGRFRLLVSFGSV